MKVVILAGGLGTRISEESHLKPKPMIEIGDRPILWHIMKLYSSYGFNDFIICCGYKGHVIKEYFMDYYMHSSDVTIDLANNSTIIHENVSEPWKVTLVNTGLNTLTAGRIKMIQKYINNETFMMTYGDGVADINIKELLAFHNKHGKIATITASKPAGRWGSLQIDEDTSQVLTFKEKDKRDQAWVNAGFAIFEPEFLDYISGNQMLENEPYEKLSRDGEMMSFLHDGFWAPMDTMRDHKLLQDLWESEEAPWKLWK
jgi:glucose-1-phosphate cytidylyltransferase